MGTPITAEQAVACARAFFAKAGLPGGEVQSCTRQEPKIDNLMATLGQIGAAVPGFDANAVGLMAGLNWPGPHWYLVFEGPVGGDGRRDVSIVQVFDDGRVELAGRRRFGDEDEDYDSDAEAEPGAAADGGA